MSALFSPSERSRLTFAAISAAASLLGLSASATADEPKNTVAQIRKDAAALLPTVKHAITREFLQATAELPEVKPRTLLRDPQTKKLYSQADAAKLDETARKALTPIPLDESFYYNTRYGSPLAYARPLEILGQAGVKTVSGRKILDFGYGTVGHLRLLARCGAQAVGVDVDPVLAALYSDPADQGAIPSKSGKSGSIRLIDGRFPAEPTVTKAVGEGYDIILSKNTLKNGYLHPAEPVDKRMLVDLGVDEATFLRALHTALKPGGKVLIYNLSPAPSKPGEPYKPWADGRTPFSIAQWEAAGFKVLAFDQTDDVAARKMGLLLGWDNGAGMANLENDLFSHYTLVEKPAR
jgi:SAM-dependent methyltransferase